MQHAVEAFGWSVGFDSDMVVFAVAAQISCTYDMSMIVVCLPALASFDTSAVTLCIEAMVNREYGRCNGLSEVMHFADASLLGRYDIYFTT